MKPDSVSYRAGCRARRNGKPVSACPAWADKADWMTGWQDLDEAEKALRQMADEGRRARAALAPALEGDAA